MIEQGPTISMGGPYSAAYCAARAAELGLKRLVLQSGAGEVEFGSMKLKFGADGGLTVTLSAPAAVSVEIGGNKVEISPKV